VTLDPKSLAVWHDHCPASEAVARELEATFPSHNDIGTYPGHGEVYDSVRGELKAANPGQYAIDRMTASANTAAGKAEGDRIAAWVWANRVRLGVRYVIWNRRIRSVTRDGEWHDYVNPVASKRGTPSGDHTNHVHISRFCDQGYTGPGASTTPADQPGTGPKFMEDVRINAPRQPLGLGETAVKLNAGGDLSVIKDPSAGVDVSVTVRVLDAAGVLVAPSEYALIWRTVVYDTTPKPKNKPTTVLDDELAVTGSNQARFAGKVAKAAAPLSYRLRLVVVTKVAGLVLDAAEVRGWSL
jgi:hypothetical protein